MRDFQRLLYDFERLAFHSDSETLYALFFSRALPVIGLSCIALGRLVSGYAFPDAAGNPRRACRLIALAGAFSLLGMALYIVVALALDSVDLTPSPTHLRFYGMLFLPVGAAGVLAILTGSARWFARLEKKPVGRSSLAQDL
jgi:hypothetical protein